MAVKDKDEVPDPRETEFHPKRRGDLLGHEADEQRLLQSFASGKMHHGWLIAGPKGIGKATLAYRLARYVFAHPHPDDARGRASLHVPMDSGVARRMISGGHSDLLVLQRPWVAKDKRIKAEISAEDARAVTEFFQRTAGEGGWRICIVDAADDLSTESANAILKILEEPPDRALFLLVSHSPGGLLPTIRSRCTRLALAPLPEGSVREIVAGIATETDAAKLDNAISLSGGSPGRALDLVNSNGALAFRRFAEMAAQRRFEMARKLQIGAVFAGRGAAEDFNVFCDLLAHWAAEQARAAAVAGAATSLADVHQEIGQSFRLVNAFNLDRRQAVLEAMAKIEGALRAA
jgi:DNA polymerase III subunit delta'